MPTTNVDLGPDVKTIGQVLEASIADYLAPMADEAIGALVVVRAAELVGHIVIARPPEADAKTPLGITRAAVAVNEHVRLYVGNETLFNAAWSWTPQTAVVLGANGALTQTVDLTFGYIVTIGLAVSPTRMIVKIGPPVIAVTPPSETGESLQNKRMPANTTTADHQLACLQALAATPKNHYARPKLNGVEITDLGDGDVTGCSCYFSRDGTIDGVCAWGDIQAGDVLCWVGSFAGFELSSATDVFDFSYEESV